METNEIKNKLEQANQYLRAAQDEIMRPAEDVVLHMVSSSSRHAIHYYLQGYLLTTKTPFSDKDPVDLLLEKCREIDPKFDHSGLNMSIEHKSKLDEANHLLDVASLVQQLVEE